MKKFIAFGLLLVLLILSAAQFNQVLNPGDSLLVTGVGDGTLQVSQNGNEAVLSFVAFTATPTRTPTNTPSPTPIPTAIPAPTVTPISGNNGIWLSQSEIVALPMSGSAWDRLKAKAVGSWGIANKKDLNINHDVLT